MGLTDATVAYTSQRNCGLHKPAQLRHVAFPGELHSWVCMGTDSGAGRWNRRLGMAHAVAVQERQLDRVVQFAAGPNPEVVFLERERDKP